MNQSHLILSVLSLICAIGLQSTDAAPPFIVKTIFFQPVDADHLADPKIRDLMEDTQEFYASEMDRHGFGRKTFDLERDKSGQMIIHHVEGKHQSHHYISNTWEKVRGDLPVGFNPSVAPWEKKDEIRVILVGGIPLVDSIALGGAYSYHSNR